VLWRKTLKEVVMKIVSVKFDYDHNVVEVVIEPGVNIGIDIWQEGQDRIISSIKKDGNIIVKLDYSQYYDNPSTFFIREHDQSRYGLFHDKRIYKIQVSSMGVVAELVKKE